MFDTCTLLCKAKTYFMKSFGEYRLCMLTVLSLRVTYVVPPCDVLEDRVRLHVTLEIYVVPGLECLQVSTHQTFLSLDTFKFNIFPGIYYKQRWYHVGTQMGCPSPLQNFSILHTEISFSNMYMQFCSVRYRIATVNQFVIQPLKTRLLNICL